MEGAQGGGGAGSRINALLDTIRVEIQTSELEGQAFKQQRDDYERKFEAHLQELNKLHNALSELERTHVQMTQQVPPSFPVIRASMVFRGSTICSRH
jgi:chromosome segregation ATPase